MSVLEVAVVGLCLVIALRLAVHSIIDLLSYFED